LDLSFDRLLMMMMKPGGTYTYRWTLYGKLTRLLYLSLCSVFPPTCLTAPHALISVGIAENKAAV